MNNISRNNGAKTPNVLGLASYEKGHRFLTEERKLGWRVYLMTSAELREAGWPGESVDAILFMPGHQSDWNLEDMLVSIAGLRCQVHLGRVVALNDCHVEKAALLREQFRSGGVFTIRLLSAEWAKLEGSIFTGSSYSAPEMRDEYAALLISLARQEWPDTSVFSDPEVVWELAGSWQNGITRVSL